jgi:hypothetical protein
MENPRSLLPILGLTNLGRTLLGEKAPSHPYVQCNFRVQRGANKKNLMRKKKNEKEKERKRNKEEEKNKYMYENKERKNVSMSENKISSSAL